MFYRTYIWFTSTIYGGRGREGEVCFLGGGGGGGNEIGKIHLFGGREKGREIKAKHPWAFQISLPNREKKKEKPISLSSYS
jgi:hypothetical protein